MAPRTYQVHEANEVLSQVRELTGRVVELSDQLPELQDQLRIAEYRTRRPTSTDSDRKRFSEAAAALRGAEDEMLKVVRSLGVMGVELKDARIGLVDFLSYREGELVELCWKLGEDQVRFWHRIGEGYAGRKRIAEGT